MESTCLCKAVAVKIDDDELFTRPRGHLCHCLNCRKTSGSAFGSNLLIEESKVTITGQEHLKNYEDKDTNSGNTVTRSFCGTCGNPITSKTAAYPGMVVLKMGIFPQIPRPEAESFTVHRQEWGQPYKGAEQYKIKRGGEKLQ
ncbi:MAG: hypothetical protein LQ347_006690 [Umbilicaria vellea]|nr:MAG: hypothetical protein LQ347_006690 [Umbilicaria vellea]